MITTNGTRLYYFNQTEKAYIGFSTLHNKVELITSDEIMAEDYVLHGLATVVRKRGSLKVAFESRAAEQLYTQWKLRMKARFPDAIIF